MTLLVTYKLLGRGEKSGGGALDEVSSFSRRIAIAGAGDTTNLRTHGTETNGGLSRKMGSTMTPKKDRPQEPPSLSPGNTGEAVALWRWAPCRCVPPFEVDNRVVLCALSKYIAFRV